ncbi:hypothetical protein BG000_009559 [Podila horticola]|nr:hypothetical protein BG000_009559 [Podila horticola]
MKFSLLVIAASVLASAQAACGGGSISKSEATNLISALTRIGNHGGMTGSVLNICEGKMCVSCWGNDYSESGLRKACPRATVLIAQDVGEGSSAWCDYPGLEGLNMVNYFKKK